VSSTPTKPELPPAGGRLSVVATPIGNLEDVTLRALRVLREADAVVAEDTRRTRGLLAHHGIAARLESFHAHSADARVGALVGELAAGAHLALVTDAGTPVVSDPGIRLIAAAAAAGVRVETLPGPSAVTAALAVAAIRCDTFRFVGFLARSGGRRRRVLEEIAHERGATVLFEAPTRLAATLRDLASHVGETRAVAVCRELTKVHEEVVRGTAAELAERWTEGARGEVTIVVEGTGAEAGAAAAVAEDEAIAARIRELLAGGTSPRDAAREIAREMALPRADAYQRVLREHDRGK
jgi:16S rRNA (cytidine1402-2'-O)-methyltransferase